MKDDEEMGLGPALHTLQQFVQDPTFATNYSELRRALRTMFADYAYWKDMCYEFEPAKHDEPVSGMSEFSEEGDAADLVRVLQLLHDHEQRINKLEKRPSWLIPE